MLELAKFYDPLENIPPLKLAFETLVIKESPMDLKRWQDQKFKDIKSLQRLRIEDSPRASADDILRVIKEGYCLRELSLSYSLLNEELLMAISGENHVRLETMRIEAHPESKPLLKISDEAWFMLDTHSPNLNLVLTSYLEDENDYDALLTTSVPITHLYLGGSPTSAMMQRISNNCPRLVELVVSSFSHGEIDEELISAAKGCPRLSAVGLGDCEITCSALVEFVRICKERLRMLYVWETSLIEDKNFDISAAVSKISSLLGRTWIPEYVPPW